MSNFKKIQNRFARSNSITQVADLISCGFELEFQGANGSSDGEIDWDRLSEAISDDWCSEDPKDWIDDCCEKTEYELLYWIVRQSNVKYSDIPWRMSRRYEEIENAARDAHSDHCENNWDMDEYRNNEPDVNTYHHKLCEVVEDCSVSGGEVTTDGACTLQEFSSALRYLFDKNTFDIDRRCSFHTHLSLNGVQHYYGKKLQSEMLAYIVNHVDELPESIRKRIAGNHEHHRLRISTDKFCAIHFHDQGTWEFRLFGAAKNYREGIACLLMAYRAMRHAYQVKSGMTEPLVQNIDQFSSDLRQIDCVSDLNDVKADIKGDRYKVAEGA